MIPKLKQLTIVVVVGFVVLAILSKPGQTSNLAQDVASMIGTALNNIWNFISTLFTAATSKK
jgi:hypothetical protein